MKRALFIVFAFLSMGLGILGIPLPVIPTVPFFLLSAYLFSRSSKRLHRWFTATALYKRYLESYVTHRSLTRPVKLVTLFTVTLSFGIGMYFAWDVVACRVILPLIWVCLSGYFLFGVKTRHKNETVDEAAKEADSPASKKPVAPK